MKTEQTLPAVAGPLVGTVRALEQQRTAFEAWQQKSPDRLWNNGSAGLGGTAWAAWQAAVAAEREACAKRVETATYRARWLSASMSSEPIKPCALAALLRSNA